MPPNVHLSGIVNVAVFVRHREVCTVPVCPMLPRPAAPAPGDLWYTGANDSPTGLAQNLNHQTDRAQRKESGFSL